MKELIERFYISIRLNGPPPVPYREILLTARIMDEIFAQIRPNKMATPIRAVIDHGTRLELGLSLTSVV
jgi:hypothetical protein